MPSFSTRQSRLSTRSSANLATRVIFGPSVSMRTMSGSRSPGITGSGANGTVRSATLGGVNEPRSSMAKLKTIEELFKGRHFDRDVVILCVRWYLRFKLSLRDLVEMMVERGLSMAHTTIMRWVQRYAPEFEKRWRRFARAVGRSWRVDETYVKIRGEWCYLYRAVDRAGRTVDFRLSPRRDVAAAKALFRKAINANSTARGQSRWMATRHRTV